MNGLTFRNEQLFDLFEVCILLNLANAPLPALYMAWQRTWLMTVCPEETCLRIHQGIFLHKNVCINFDVGVLYHENHQKTFLHQRQKWKQFSSGLTFWTNFTKVFKDLLKLRLFGTFRPFYVLSKNFCLSVLKKWTFAEAVRFGQSGLSLMMAGSTSVIFTPLVSSN